MLKHAPDNALSITDSSKWCTTGSLGPSSNGVLSLSRFMAGSSSPLDVEDKPESGSGQDSESESYEWLGLVVEERIGLD